MQGKPLYQLKVKKNEKKTHYERKKIESEEYR